MIEQFLFGMNFFNKKKKITLIDTNSIDLSVVCTEENLHNNLKRGYKFLCLAHLPFLQLYI